MCILVSLALLSLSKTIIKADSDYQAFESIEIFEGKFLKQYTKDEYNTYYKKTNKRMFSGWRTYVVNDSSKVTYKTETIFSYYNDGKTAIDYEYKFEGSYSSSRSITSTGQIGVNLSGPIKKFKGGLDASLKVVSSYETTKKKVRHLKLNYKLTQGQWQIYISMVKA